VSCIGTHGHPAVASNVVQASTTYPANAATDAAPTKAVPLPIMALRSAVLAVAVLVATACAGQAAPAGAKTTAPPASPPVAAAAEPTHERRAALRTMVDAAGLNPADVGTTTPPTEETALTLTIPCNTPLRVVSVASHSWSWSGTKPAVVSHGVFAYDPEPGSAVVDQVRPALAACKAWIWAMAWEMDVVGEFGVQRPVGADDSVAYCHQGTILTGASKGDKAFLCDGVLSRGHLVATVATVSLTLPEAQNDLAKAVALAAAALVRAVPSP
jgi:hypothetical protein